MFKHQGKSRTFKHNLQLATVLSLVAGIVNICGFLSIQQLTTNVTGHFALLIYDVANSQFLKAATYFGYIFSFFIGSFTSSFLIESFLENKRLNVYVIPTFIECIVLLLVVLMGYTNKLEYPNVIACLLLFAMGLQNSFVTKISKAVVRTTHLTGLFTDLGIELSQLLFPKRYPLRKKIKTTIKLRIYIITSFFIGGLSGAYLFIELDLKLKTLIIAILILLFGVFYDDFKYRILITKRKFTQKTS